MGRGSRPSTPDRFNQGSRPPPARPPSAPAAVNAPAALAGGLTTAAGRAGAGDAATRAALRRRHSVVSVSPTMAVPTTTVATTAQPRPWSARGAVLPITVAPAVLGGGPQGGG